MDSAAKRERDLGIEAWIAIAVVLVFLANVAHYFFWSDDAFISFRYARHLVDGLGLVWNPGERVEGYTNFLWVMLAAGFLKVGVAPEVVMPGIGIVSGFSILLLLGYLEWNHDRRFVLWLSLSALAFHRSFSAWCSGGLETQFFSLLVFAASVALLRERARSSKVRPLSALLFGAALLTRPDGALFVVVAAVWLLVDAAARRRPFTGLIAWSGVILGIAIPHLLWRHWYYGFWLPNTFYAKVNGVWWDQGFKYLDLFAREYYLHYFTPFVVVSVWCRRDFRSSLFAAFVLAQLAYLGSVGGDHIEFRLLVPILPYLYWLIADGIDAVAGLARWPRAAPTMIRAGGAAAVLLTTIAGSLYPLERDGETNVGTTMSTGAYGTLRMSQGRQLRALVDAGVLPRDLRIETGAAGALPYYTDWYVLDKRGLNDVHVAHQRVAQRGVVGHEHSASLAYVRERRIAVVLLGHELLHEGGPPQLRNDAAVAKILMDFYNSSAPDPQDRLRLECRSVGPGHELIFGTNLAAAEFDPILGHLPKCPEP